MRFVAVVEDDVAQGLGAPPSCAVWCWHLLLLEDTLDGAYREALYTDHLEDAPYDRHGLFVYYITVPVLVEIKSEGCHSARYNLALFGLPQFAPPGSLRRLCSLKLRQLVEDAVGKLTLRGVVSPVIEGAYLRPVLLELTPQEVVIGGLAGEAVPVLGEYHEHAASSDEVPHAVHAGSLKGCAALAGVLYFLEDLVAFSGG